MIRLGKIEESAGALKILNMLMTAMSAEKKIKMLEDEGVKMTREFKKEVEDMCDWTEAFAERAREDGWEQGLAKGRAEGRAEGRAKGRAEGKEEAKLSAVRNIMRSLNLAADKALTAVGIPQAEWDNYLPRLT